MPFAQFNAPKGDIKPLDTDRYLDDVSLAEMLLDNAIQNDGVLSSADIVFSLRNFFYNVSFPIRFVNNLLQGKFEGAGYEFVRFSFNSTVGLAGFFDLASSQLDLPNYDEDLGQTFGSWGIDHGIFITLPILGPTSIRDGIGMAGRTDDLLRQRRLVAHKTSGMFAVWTLAPDPNCGYNDSGRLSLANEPDGECSRTENGSKRSR